MSKISEKNPLCTSSHSMFTHKVPRKKEIFGGTYKNTKMCLMKSYYGEPEIVFFTQATKKFFHETLCANIKCSATLG
jgi:hypothetical protein